MKLLPALFAVLLSAQTFEVASVRPHEGTAMRSGPLIVSGPLVRLQGYTLFGLVMDALNLRDFQLEFAPVAKRVDVFDTMYDISAKAPGDGVPNVGDVRAMLQTLLAERFALRFHRERREMQVWSLVAGKPPGALVPAAAGGACAIRNRMAADGRNDEVTFTACGPERLADVLTHMVGDRPVVDHTELTGIYDFRLVAIPAYRVRNQPETVDVDPLRAIEKLGLKAVRQKLPVEIVVVDQLEKPTGN